MCLGIPGLVLERHEPDDELAWALVEFAGLKRRICLACVPEARPGDYVIVHAGIAISRIDPEEAGRVFAFLEQSGDSDGWDAQAVDGGQWTVDGGKTTAGLD